MSISHTHTAATQPAIAKSDWSSQALMRRSIDTSSCHPSFLATPAYLASTRSSNRPCGNRPRSNGTAAAPIVGDPS